MNLFAALVTLVNVTSAQIPTTFIETLIEAEEVIADDIISQSIRKNVQVRVINNRNADRILIMPEVVLSEATLNIIDEAGNPLIAYHFNHLSEIDLSIKRLPAGDYTLNLHSKEGSSSHKVFR